MVHELTSLELLFNNKYVTPECVPMIIISKYPRRYILILLNNC